MKQGTVGWLHILSICSKVEENMFLNPDSVKNSKTRQ